MSDRPLPQNANSTRITRYVLVLIIVTIYIGAGTRLFRKSSWTLYSTVYSRMAEGFAAGHLYMPTQAPVELLNLENPYDRLRNWNIITDPKINIWDLSLFEGRLYAYFGVVPTLVAFLPYRLVTGTALDDGLAAILFLSIAFAIASQLLFEIKDKHFSKTPEWMLLTSVVFLSVLNFSATILKHPFVYEVAIAGGLCFGLASILSLNRFFDNSNNKLSSLGLSSLYAGLAFGCRPVYVMYVPVLMFAVAGSFIALKNINQRLKFLFALFLPLGIIFAGLGAYNYSRFGSPFDFGWHYQLNGFNVFAQSPLEISRLAVGLYYLLLHQVHIVSTFPYVDFSVAAPSWLTVPPEYLAETAAGLLVVVPYFSVGLISALICVVLVREKYVSIFPIREFLIVFLTGILAMCFIAAHISSAIRYHCDIESYLILAATICRLTLDQLLITRPRYRNVMRAVWLITGFVSAAIVTAVGLAS